VLHAEQLLTGGERDLAISWLSDQLGKPVVPVVNFWNRVSEHERAALRGRLRRWARTLRTELERPSFEVNALGALRFALSHIGSPDEGTDALRRSLTQLSDSQRDDLQDRSRRGLIRAELARIRHENAQRLPHILADEAAAVARRWQRRRDLNTLLGRLEADARLRGETVLAWAEEELNRGLDHLIGVRFRGESKAALEAHAARWYRQHLEDVVCTIQREAEQALKDISGGALSVPASLELGRGLDFTVHLNDPPAPFPQALVEQVLDVALRPSRTLVEWLWGKPDLAPVYAARARDRWSAHQRQILDRLRARGAEAASGLFDQVRAQLAAVPPDEPVKESMVRDRAHQLWLERGQHEQAAERDWLDAEAMLWNEVKDTYPEALVVGGQCCQQRLNLNGQWNLPLGADFSALDGDPWGARLYVRGNITHPPPKRSRFTSAVDSTKPWSAACRTANSDRGYRDRHYSCRLGRPAAPRVPSGSAHRAGHHSTTPLRVRCTAARFAFTPPRWPTRRRH
jgi:hypothetical protein